MKIVGIDFTSAPRRSKPITCLRCSLESGLLRAESLDECPNFACFEDALRAPGPWIAGIDFPFGQARTFIENIGWPGSWRGYVTHAARLGRQGFREAMDRYRQDRAIGDKEHRRRTDVAAGSISPQKLYGVPVGLMFLEGAPRLLRAGVMIPSVHNGDSDRIVVEAYPGVLARQLIGRRPYKHDTKSKQNEELLNARQNLFRRILNARLASLYGFRVQAPGHLVEDPTGDRIDALLCAIQAAWAWTQRGEGFGAPTEVDPLEGWIADPTLTDIHLTQADAE